MALSKRDRKELGRYLRWVANEMELRDWTVALAHEPCSADAEGHASCVDGQRHITVSVNEHFRDSPPEDQRETIVHELIHAHHSGCWRMVQTDLAEALGKPVYYVFCDSYRRAMELNIDALSKTIAKHMPPIDWPKAKRK